MKYIVIGRENTSFHGTNQYNELGWETHVFNIDLRKRLIENKINSNEYTIVTTEDRMFLYETIFENVISYTNFKTMKIDENNIESYHLNSSIKEPNNEIINLLHKYKNITTSFKKCDVDDNKPYFILHIRDSTFANNRNYPSSFYTNLTNEIKKKCNLKCYIFGAGAKKYEDVNNNIIHVNLKKYCSLLNNEKCSFIIGPISGGTNICQFVANENTRIYVIVVGVNKYGYGAGSLWYDDKCNFTNSPTKFVNRLDVSLIINMLLTDKLIGV